MTAILSGLATNALLATGLAGVALFAGLCRCRPAVLHALWLLVLLKLVTPPLLHLPLPEYRPSVAAPPALPREAYNAPAAADELAPTDLSSTPSTSNVAPPLVQPSVLLSARQPAPPDTGPEGTWPPSPALPSPVDPAWPPMQNATPPTAELELPLSPGSLASAPRDASAGPPVGEPAPPPMARSAPDQIGAAATEAGSDASTARPRWHFFAARAYFAPALLSLWLGGALLWWGTALLRMARFRQALSTAQPAGADVERRVQEWAGRLGLRRAPPASTLDACVPPLLWSGCFRPRLLLPQPLWSSLSPEQQDSVLVHELAHLRRGDHLVRWLELLALGAYWWLPAAWQARRELQRTEELCCDAWVVWALPTVGQAYARALLDTAAFVAAERVLLPAGASGMRPLTFLKRRIAMVLQAETPRGLTLRGKVLWVALAALFLPLGFVLGQGQAPVPPAIQTQDTQAGSTQAPQAAAAADAPMLSNAPAETGVLDEVPSLAQLPPLPGAGSAGVPVPAPAERYGPAPAPVGGDRHPGEPQLAIPMGSAPSLAGADRSAAATVQQLQRRLLELDVTEAQEDLAAIERQRDQAMRLQEQGVQPVEVVDELNYKVRRAAGRYERAQIQLQLFDLQSQSGPYATVQVPVAVAAPPLTVPSYDPHARAPQPVPYGPLEAAPAGVPNPEESPPAPGGDSVVQPAGPPDALGRQPPPLDPSANPNLALDAPTDSPAVIEQLLAQLLAELKAAEAALAADQQQLERARAGALAEEERLRYEIAVSQGQLRCAELRRRLQTGLSVLPPNALPAAPARLTQPTWAETVALFEELQAADAALAEARVHLAQAQAQPNNAADLERCRAAEAQAVERWTAARRQLDLLAPVVAPPPMQSSPFLNRQAIGELDLSLLETMMQQTSQLLVDREVRARQQRDAAVQLHLQGQLPAAELQEYERLYQKCVADLRRFRQWQQQSLQEFSAAAGEEALPTESAPPVPQTEEPLLPPTSAPDDESDVPVAPPQDPAALEPSAASRDPGGVFSFELTPATVLDRSGVTVEIPALGPR